MRVNFLGLLTILFTGAALIMSINLLLFLAGVIK